MRGALFISQSLITRSQFIYGYRKGKGLLHAENTKHRQILRKSACRIVNYTHLGIQKHHLGQAILFIHNKQFCFSMNNAVLVALFGHI